MFKNPQDIDLSLWLDQDIIPRQNKLKASFWEILGEVGNSINTKNLTVLHPTSRGAKLSKGNDLVGYPYQVLDLVRDFNLLDGMNIRILNWFGHGLFLFFLLGKNHPKAPVHKLIDNNWVFDVSHTPWEYPEILLNNAFTSSPTNDLYEKSSFLQWHKTIELSGEANQIKTEILSELKNLIFLLS